MFRAMKNMLVLFSLLLALVSGVFGVASCLANPGLSGWVQTPSATCSEFHIGPVTPIVNGELEAVLVCAGVFMVVVALAVLLFTRAPRILGRAVNERAERWRWVWAKRWPFSMMNTLFIPRFFAMRAW